MPTTPAIDAEAQPLFSIQFEALLEGLDGNGVDAADDLNVTDGTGDNETDIATGTAHYDGTTATLGSTATVTHSDGDGSNDRWDIIVFDVGTGGVTLREGTAAATPVPPDLQPDEVLLALVYVASSQTDFGSGDIVNWRVPAGTMAVADSGTDVLTDAVDIDFAAGVQASDGGTSTATVKTDPGNGLENTGGQIVVSSGGIQTDELDLTITPTWTSEHQFDAGLDTRGDIVDNATTVWDTSAGHIPRSQIDDERVTKTSITSNTTTSGEEVLLVDTSSSAVTITLASADVSDGNIVTVVDEGGNAATNNITVDTESSETIDGGSSDTIDTDHGAAVYVSDGTNWFSAGGGGNGSSVTNETVVADESGSVSAGNFGTVFVTEVPDGSTIEITQAYLTLADGQAVPSGCDLILATLAGDGTGTSRTTLISGDGSTVFADETGSPLGSWTNSTGSAQTVALGVDNGNFNSGSGSSQDVAAGGIGEVV